MAVTSGFPGLARQLAEARRRMPDLPERIDKLKPVLDRLARSGDCLACYGTPNGCQQHMRLNWWPVHQGFRWFMQCSDPPMGAPSILRPDPSAP